MQRLTATLIFIICYAFLLSSCLTDGHFKVSAEIEDFRISRNDEPSINGGGSDDKK